MENNQSAVEWLECELKKIPYINPIEAFRQAKQMEKENTKLNMIKAFNEGYDKGLEDFKEELKKNYFLIPKDKADLFFKKM